MDTVEKLYEKGLPQFEEDLGVVVDLLLKGENISFCSAPKMGDNMFLDYLAFKLSKDVRFDIVYHPKNDLNFRKIRSELCPSDKIKVIIVPWLHDPIPGFYREFEDLFLSSRENEFQSVIRLHYDFWHEPRKYFPRSVRPVSTIRIRKPLTTEMTRAVIDQRRMINGWEVPERFEKEIHQMSGGIPGLIKRLSSYVNAFGGLEFNEVINYPPTVMSLMEFQDFFKEFDEDELHKFGLTEKNGKIKSDLVEAVVEKKNLEKELSNSPMMKTAFDYFFDHQGKVVTLEELADALGSGDDYSMWGIYKLITRLKNKVKPEYRLRNVRKKGYIMEKVR